MRYQKGWDPDADNYWDRCSWLLRDLMEEISAEMAWKDRIKEVNREYHQDFVWSERLSKILARRVWFHSDNPSSNNGLNSNNSNNNINSSNSAEPVYYRSAVMYNHRPLDGGNYHREIYRQSRHRANSETNMTFYTYKKSGRLPENY